MKPVLVWGSLAALGFVAYQQWDCHQHSLCRANPRPPQVVETVCTGPVTIRGRVYTAKELHGLYNRVRNNYVMCNGVCWHRWQNPDAPALSYSDFVHQFKNGYAFAELSEPGSGDTVVLEHRINRRRVEKCGN